MYGKLCFLLTTTKHVNDDSYLLRFINLALNFQDVIVLKLKREYLTTQRK